MIAFKDRWFTVEPEANGWLLFMHYFEEDIINGKLQQQTTRGWWLNETASESQVVQTALKCVITSQEHVAREHFTYQGERIFHPHQDINELLRIARTR